MPVEEQFDVKVNVVNAPVRRINIWNNPETDTQKTIRQLEAIPMEALMAAAETVKNIPSSYKRAKKVTWEDKLFNKLEAMWEQSAFAKTKQGFLPEKQNWRKLLTEPLFPLFSIPTAIRDKTYVAVPKQHPLYDYDIENPVNFIDSYSRLVPAASRSIIGTPYYYEWRHEDFKARNPGKKAPEYYLNYGLKYAERFRDETSKMVSPRGQKWINEVMINLQNAMEERLTDSKGKGAELELDEQAFKRFAYNSHIEAYWNGKPGSTPLYTLNTVDLFAILLTPNLEHLIDEEGRKQAIEIMKKMTDYWIKNPEVGLKRNAEFLLNRRKIIMMAQEKAIREGVDKEKAIDFIREILKNIPTISTDK